MSPAALALEAVSVAYGTPAPRLALDGVSVEIIGGGLTVVMGPSGSGKSTLLHVAGGLQAPTSGTVTLGGTRLDQLSLEQRAALRLSRVGYVFQEYNLIEVLSASENVALPLELSGVDRIEATERARRCLDQVGLSCVAEHLPAQLSGGEQQRTAIARALALPRGVLLGDEVTGALDSANSEEVVRLVRELADDGATCVLATHDPEVAEVADRVVELRDGRVVGDTKRGAT